MMEVSIKRPLSETITIQDSPPQRIIKRLRLTKRHSKAAPPALVLTQLFTELENSSSSNESLEILINISEILTSDEIELGDQYKKLIEHFKRENESAVRVKVLSLFREFQIDTEHDLSNIVDELILMLKNETSSKVICQGLRVLFKLGRGQTTSIINRVLEYAKIQLTSSSHNVQKHAIMVLGGMMQNPESGRKVLDLIGKYTDSQDARVRAEVFRSILSLGKTGVVLPATLYERAADALADDYEGVRKETLQLIYELGILHPEEMITINDSGNDSQIRLVDAAFGKLCTAICDLSMQVRTQAAELLGGLTKVSSDFLNQTLDKKLMSNMRKKKSLHERALENMASGEWSTGKKWGDDVPTEHINYDSISLLESGACGAFVHGLEDEFLEVRTASVNSLCRLALVDAQFAVSSLDFLVDMFNDEIEAVRLKSIYALTTIARHIILREDQLETMLSALEDFSVEIREGLHIMLGACKVSTQACLTMVVQKVLDVLTKYPQDKLSAYGCLQKVGAKHSQLCMSLVPQLLQDHPFFDCAERDVEDPSYVCILILLFNAAQNMPPMITLFPETTIKHYGYLRNTMPNLVPHLPLGDHELHRNITGSSEMMGSFQFLETLLHNIRSAYNAPRARQALLTAAQENLDRLATIDPSLSGTAHFTATFLGAQLAIEILQASISGTGHQSRIPSKEYQNQLVKKCLKLQNIFTGLSQDDWLLVKQICLRASALNIVLIVRDRSQSALAPCQLFLHIASDMSNFLQDTPSMVPDDFTASVLTQLANLSDPKPGRVFREILPFIQAASPVVTPKINTNIKICTAEISEPCTSNTSDNIIKVTAGLIASIPLVARVDYLQESQRQDLRVRIKYPDQNTHFIVPRLSDLKRIITEQGEEENNWRLRTTVLLSHGIWTEAAQVEITICLYVRLGTELELSKPVKVMFSPKPVKWRI